MYKISKTYEDFDGNERTEDLYFNFTKAELIDMQNSKDGGLVSLLEKIIKENDQLKMMEYFKEIVLKSYGIKSPDGRGFAKSDSIREDFKNSAVYSEIYTDLYEDAEKAIAFVNGIMPKDIRSDLSGKSAEEIRAEVLAKAN